MLLIVRKSFHRLLYFLRFVIDETKDKRILEDIKQLKVQDEELQKVNEDGSYPCRAHGCSTTFAHNGKRRRDHEANHDPPVVIPDVSSNYTLNVDPQYKREMTCYVRLKRLCSSTGCYYLISGMLFQKGTATGFFVHGNTFFCTHEMRKCQLQNILWKLYTYCVK